MVYFEYSNAHNKIFFLSHTQTNLHTHTCARVIVKCSPFAYSNSNKNDNINKTYILCFVQ